MPPLRIPALLAASLLATVLASAAPAPQLSASDDQLRAAKAQVDRLADQRDDAARLAGAQAFLKQFPHNYWRHLGYRLWLYSAWRLHSQVELERAADAYLAEFPDDPEAHGAISRYFLEAGVLRERGLDSANNALQFYERDLTLDGSMDAMRRENSVTADLPAQPDWQPPSERDRFINYLGSRFNLARYQLTGNQKQAALRMVEPVIALAPFSSDEEETLAPFYFVAGQAYEALSDMPKAYGDYLAAVAEGDPQNRYAGQAESRMHAIEGQLSDDQRTAVLKAAVPPALAHLPLPRFTDITDAAGLTGVQASRVAWGDVNGDQYPDLLLDGSRLFLNAGDKGFFDASKDWGLKPGRRAGLFADYDNDGKLDLYTIGAGTRENRLLRNTGKAFEDVTAVAGDPTSVNDCTAGAWVDYDRDGWVDFYLAAFSKVARGLGEPTADGAPDALFHNTAGVLREVDAATVGLGSAVDSPTASAGVCVSDYNSDGAPDIFVANRAVRPSFLWKSEAGAFSDVAATLGICQPAGEAQAFSSAADWGDVNNDGHPDLFVCNWFDASQRFLYQPSALYQSTANGSAVSFANVRASKGIRAATALTEPLFADFNNDGFLDLYLTSSGQGQRSYLYVNDGAGGWHEMAYLAGCRVMGAQGCASADIDRDGDLDLLVCTPSGVRLFRSDVTPQNWLEVECVGGMRGGKAPADGVWSNSSAIGARVTVTLGGEKSMREVQSGKGSGCGNDLLAHFGFGKRSGRMTVGVRFPSGREVTRAMLVSNQRIAVNEYEPQAQPRRSATPPATHR